MSLSKLTQQSRPFGQIDLEPGLQSEREFPVVVR